MRGVVVLFSHVVKVWSLGLMSFAVTVGTNMWSHLCQSRHSMLVFFGVRFQCFFCFVHWPGVLSLKIGKHVNKNGGMIKDGDCVCVSSPLATILWLATNIILWGGCMWTCREIKSSTKEERVSNIVGLWFEWDRYSTVIEIGSFALTKCQIFAAGYIGYGYKKILCNLNGWNEILLS